MFMRLFREERGQDIVEYALLASLISIFALATIQLIGPLLVTIYQAIVTALS